MVSNGKIFPAELLPLSAKQTLPKAKCEFIFKKLQLKCHFNFQPNTSLSNIYEVCAHIFTQIVFLAVFVLS